MPEVTTVTPHRMRVFLTHDLAVEFSVFDHHTSHVPSEAWGTFVSGYQHAHGCDPAATLTEYVIERAAWSWDTTYTDGTVIIGEPEGPLALESGPDGPKGCRVVFWDDGNCYDTGLRVWEEEAAILARFLREKAERDVV